MAITLLYCHVTKESRIRFSMDVIFKALNDPARRALLDSLRAKDGQTLTELEEQLDMTRFGVMKHLKVLEDAHLVTTKKVGRFKYHYLNPLPLQEVMDRWLHPFLGPQAQALSRLKQTLEQQHMKPDLVLSTYIDCSHDALWDALTKGDLMAQYHFACDRITGAHETPGDSINMMFPGSDGVMLSNRLISIDPKTRIEMSFAPGWEENAHISRCIYLLEPQPKGMKLTVEHYELGPNDGNVNDGWTRFLASLKSWLETGRTARFPMTAA